jgi:hypothetical protein
MSLHMVRQAFADRSVKRPSDKLVLLALASCHNPDGGCFPSKETLMDMTQLGLRTIETSLAQLVADKKITKVQGWGRGNINHFILCYPDKEKKPRKPADPAGFKDDIATLENPQILPENPQILRQNPQILRTKPKDPAPFTLVAEPILEPINGNRTVINSNKNRERTHSRPSTPKKGKAKSNTQTLRLDVRPTFEELVAFCASEDMADVAEDIDNYWSYKGFITGKTPIKDWQAFARNWKKREAKFAANNNRNSPVRGASDETLELLSKKQARRL